MDRIWLGSVFLVAYLIGSISTAIIVGRFMAGDDIRSHGSGNAGATNALRTYGKKAAVFVVLGDCLKAVAAILVGMIEAKVIGANAQTIQLAVYIAGVGAVLGHNFPLYFKFRGGKGILVSTVAILFADWKIGLAVIVFSILIMAITRYVSLGSVLGSVALVILGFIFHFGDTPYLIFAVILAVSAIFMHRGNIKRLINGTENKLGSKKNTDD